MPLDTGGGYGSGVTRPKNINPVNRLPHVSQGRPSRPKIKDVGGGEVEVTGYHATRQQGDWAPHEQHELHMGTQAAALDRMKVVKPAATGLGYRTEVDPEHHMYKVTARMPRDAVMGLRQGVSDVDANALGGLRQGFSPPRHLVEEHPEQVGGVMTGRTKAIGYTNTYEDPGSRSWVVTDPSSISNVSKLYDMGSTATGLWGLASMIAPLIPGFSERFQRTNYLMQGGPLGDAFNWTLQNSPDSPYNPKLYGSTAA